MVCSTTLSIGVRANGQVTTVKTLADCISIALEEHPSLKAAAASVEAGSQRVRQAFSNYLPQVSASSDATRHYTSAGARTGTKVGPSSKTNFYSAGVGFSQVLFDFGQTLNSIRSAQASVQSLDADRDQQRATIVLAVKQAYFSLLAARHLLTVADDAVRQGRQHLELAEGRFEVGLAPKFDVTSGRVQLANSQLNQLSARNNAAIGRETLRNALGLDKPLDFDIADVADVRTAVLAENEAVNRAYDNRPELRSLDLQAQALSDSVAALQKDYLPFITGNGEYGWSGNDYPRQPNWTIGAAVNLSVFNGGLTTAQIGEAKANLANLRYNQEVLRQSIALEVRRAVLNVQQAAESIDVAHQGQIQARENLELAEGRYQTGVGNIIELTDAQAARTTAEANYVQATYSYQTSLAALEKATASEVASDDAAAIRRAEDQ
jgi:outer membrane protein TolC